MKKTLLTLAAFAFFGAAHAQSLMPQVVASGGGSGQNAQVALDWTIGEPVIETVSDGTSTLTQGFEQPTLQIITGLTSPSVIEHIVAYPNPTADYITILFNQNECYNYQVYDLKGKLILNGKANKSNPVISFQGMASGQYTLNLSNTENNNQIQNISIIKQN